jgi:hypothetical protein
MDLIIILVLLMILFGTNYVMSNILYNKLIDDYDKKIEIKIGLIYDRLKQYTDLFETILNEQKEFDKKLKKLSKKKAHK